MAGRPHPPEVKAAVMAALLAGQGVSELASKYNIPQQTVSAWKQHAISIAGTKKEIGVMVGELLEAILTGTRDAATQLSDAEWRAKQPAAELGTFFGIAVDKAVRLLDAAERAAAAQRAAADGGETS